MKVGVCEGCVLLRSKSVKVGWYESSLKVRRCEGRMVLGSSSVKVRWCEGRVV